MRLMPKYCVSTRVEIAGGGMGRWVSGMPGSARFTSSRTKSGVQSFTSWGVWVINSPSGMPARTASTQRALPMQRGSVTLPS